jgi:hypothetical protein
MIYRTINGDIIIINKMDFKNDKLFYKKIMDIKKPFTKLNKFQNNINDINGTMTSKQI